MSLPYISEIRIMSFNYAPNGWALCNGQTMQIRQYQALFSLIGTTYGGDGIQTFQLPNLQGRVPLHFSGNYRLGSLGGEASHTLTMAEMSGHTHTLRAKAMAADDTAAGVLPSPAVTLAQAFATQAGGVKTPVSNYGTGSPTLTMAPNALANTGGQPHPNQQPYLVLNFCIALVGIFPSRG
jgi:microcystin-dependent protein